MWVNIKWKPICDIECTFYEGKFYVGVVKGDFYIYNDIEQTLHISKDNKEIAKFNRIEYIKKEE